MKSMHRSNLISFLLFALIGVTPALGDLINFENLTDGTVIDASYVSQGILFQNAVIATAGISLNEFEFPPHSGTNVAIDELGPITLTFTTPVSGLSGYFTYTVPLRLTAYGTGGTIVDTAISRFSANFVSSGNPPNELISLSFAGGISRVSIDGDPVGNSFTLDDLSFTSAAVPEPSSLLFYVPQLFLLVVFRNGYFRYRQAS